MIASKWLASFFRSEWKLVHYPVRVRKNGENVTSDQQWLAQILNWPGPGGVGATREEAVAKLGESLESIRTYRRTNHEKMPRPGSKVPIQFASTERILADPALHDDFITRVLGFQCTDPIFISDQSSLSDFGDAAHVARLQKRIQETYSVDVSDLKDGVLYEIFDRIRQQG